MKRIFTFFIGFWILSFSGNHLLAIGSSSEPDSSLIIEIRKKLPDGTYKVTSLVPGKKVDIATKSGQLYKRVLLTPYNEDSLLIEDQMIPLDEVSYITGKTKSSRQGQESGFGAILIGLALISILGIIAFFVFLIDLVNGGGGGDGWVNLRLLAIPLFIVGTVLLFAGRRRYSIDDGWRFRIRKRRIT